MAKRHLWEVEHAFYCEDVNYYAPGDSQPCGEYKSWADFIDAFGDSDPDWNLLFRWDWVEGTDNGAIDFNGDENYHNGILKLFWMGQRKGLYFWSTVEVCRADENAVVEFLRPRLRHLIGLWEPLTLTDEKVAD